MLATEICKAACGLLGGALDFGPPLAVQYAQSIQAEMARELAAGCQTVAGWIRDDRWEIEQLEYVRVVCQTRAWAAFVAPAVCGATIASPGDPRVLWIRRFAVLLGVASCIQGETQDPTSGPGRRSLPVLHAVNAAEPGLREELLRALAAPAAQPPKLVERAMRVAGSIAHAHAFARHLAHRANAALERACVDLPPSKEREFFDTLVDHVLQQAR